MHHTHKNNMNSTHIKEIENTQPRNYADIIQNKKIHNINDKRNKMTSSSCSRSSKGL